jgi:hypothetical protein
MKQPTRRDFLRETAAITCAVGTLRAAEGLAADTGAPARGSGPLPKIKLGKLEVSRLILGSNPFFGFHHGNPHATAQQMREYYTDQRIMQVLDEAAQEEIFSRAGTRVGTHRSCEPPSAPKRTNCHRST